MYSLSFLFISHVVLITINIILIYQWQPHFIYVSVFLLHKVLVRIKFASHHRHTIMENTNVAEVVFSEQSRIFGTLSNIHLLYSPPIDCRRIKKHPNHE